MECSHIFAAAVSIAANKRRTNETQILNLEIFWAFNQHIVSDDNQPLGDQVEFAAGTAVVDACWDDNINRVCALVEIGPWWVDGGRIGRSGDCSRWRRDRDRSL